MRSKCRPILLFQVIMQWGFLTDAFSLRGPAVLETRHISRIQKVHPSPRVSQTSPGIQASVSDVQESNAADDPNGVSPQNGNANNNEVEETKPAPMSKAKWKKKRYLMMEDVTKLIKKGDSHAPKKAEETVARMRKLSEVHQDPDMRPNEHIYNMWINAIAKCSKNGNAGQQAEQVLVQMQRDGVEPSIVSYTSIMDAYASSSTRRNKAAEEAERVLFDVLEQQPTNIHNGKRMAISSITCDTVLKAWANRGDMKGAERAEEILNRLEQMQNESIRPTVFSYGTVIHAWASCKGGIPAAETAEGILKRMMLPSSRVKPDTVIFNSVIHAWSNSKSPETGQKASQLLHLMRELHNARKEYDTAPDERTYNNVLAAWSHSSHANAATETERIVKEMQEAYKKAPKKSPAPSTVSFNSVLHAWSRSPLPGGVKRAEAVLEFMIMAKRPEIAPDVISFTSVLNALAKSKEPDKAVRAQKLLNTMIRMYEINKRPSLKPSQIPFNAVLNACAFSASDTTTKQKQEVLKVAVTTFTELQNRARPDTVSYGNMMKCYHNLMPPGPKRNELALKLFDSCSKQGLVGELLWTEVCRTTQSRVLAKHLKLKKSPGSLCVEDLPKSWTHNVRGDKLMTRRRTQAEARRRASEEEKQMAKKKRTPDRRRGNITEPSYQSGKDL